MPASPDYPELNSARADWRYQPQPDCLDGKVILVTGAGDGIGSTAARTFACYGASVILLGRTRSKLEAVSDWITTNTATEPVIVPSDLLSLGEENANALADATMDAFGRLDGLLHNASLLGPKVPISHYPAAEWQRVFTVNTHAVFLLTRALLPLLERSASASVVMTSSSVGRAGRAYWGAYAVSKFAIEGLTQVLADEYEHAGKIRVNSLNPGGTRTSMRRAAYPMEDPAAVPVPETHMDLYLYLMSQLSHGVTGKQFDAREWAGPEATERQ
jgi:NAD(P)-dependent dehydrogenase (short-subunit alcohol dehydrogenase family)